MIDKKKSLERWKPILDSLELSGDTKNWMEDYSTKLSNFCGPIDSGSTPTNSIYNWDWSKPLLPIAMKIQATTLGSGGWIKSKKQQLKETRINKLRKIKGKKPNVVLPNDKFIDGLVAVQPMSMPTGQLFYMDFKYGPNIKEQRKEKLEKLNKLSRIEKIKYIEEILQKIIQ